MPPYFPELLRNIELVWYDSICIRHLSLIRLIKIFSENKIEAKEWHDQNPVAKETENLIPTSFGRKVS